MESQPNPLQPNDQSYHPKHHIKVYVWIALVVAALLVAINGYLYFLRLSYLEQGARIAQEEEHRIQELRQQRQNSDLEAQLPSDIPADWQTYRNEEYGFEFRYPVEWEPKISDSYPKNKNVVAKFIADNKEHGADSLGQPFYNKPELISFVLTVFSKYTVPFDISEATTECHYNNEKEIIKDSREITSQEILISMIKTKIYTLDNRNAYVDISTPPSISMS